MSNIIHNQKETETKNNFENENNIYFWDNIKEDINSLLNNILNMENKEQLTEKVNELKSTIFKLIDKMNKDKNDINKEITNMKQTIANLNEDKTNMKEEINNLKEKITTLNEDNAKMKDKINDLITNKNKMEIKMDNLENCYLEIKEVLGDIQMRDMAKNLLKCFKRYLTDEDKDKIKSDKDSKGLIISERIKKIFIKNKYKNENRLAIIQNVIINACDLLNRGNDMAHSLTIENYQDEIINYKEKNNLKSLNFPETFVF